MTRTRTENGRSRSETEEDSSRVAAALSTGGTVAIEAVLAVGLTAWAVAWSVIAAVNASYGDYVATAATVGMLVLPALAYEYHRLSAYLPVPDLHAPDVSVDLPTSSAG